MTLALALIAPVLAQPAPPVPFKEPGLLEEPAAPAAPAPAAPLAPPTAPEGTTWKDLALQVPGVPDWIGGPPPQRLPIRTIMDQRVEVREPSNDLFAMGQDVSVRGPVSDNAFVMAQNLDIDSPVSGDLFAMGENVTIDQPIMGDLYAMGARVEVTSSGSVAGSIKGAAAELILRGPVAGDVQAEVGRLVLAAPIAGDVEVQFGEVELEPGAAIAGDLAYASPNRSPDLEAAVAGEVEHTETELEIDLEGMNEPEPEASFLSTALWWGTMRGWGYLTKLLVGVVLFLIGGERIAAIGRRAASHPGQSLGIGFIAACVLPVASFGAVITVVPFPLGLLGFAFFAMMLYLGQIFAAHALGDLLLKRFQPGAVGSPYLSLAVGLVPLMLLCAIPWLGNLAWLAATFAGFGAVWAVMRGQA